MTPGEIGAMIQNLNNTALKLSESTGPAVGVEIRMRLIGELSETVKKNLQKIVLAKLEEEGESAFKVFWKVIKKQPNHSIENENYEQIKKECIKKYIQKNKGHRPSKPTNCKLEDLEQAVIETFRDELSSDEIQKIASFRKQRNDLFHASFAALLRSIGKKTIDPTPNHHIGRPTIYTGIMNLERQQGFEVFRRQANELNAILEAIMISHC